MRDQGFIISGERLPQTPSERTRKVETFEDALAPEVAHENAAAFAMMRGSLQGVKLG